MNNKFENYNPISQKEVNEKKGEISQLEVTGIPKSLETEEQKRARIKREYNKKRRENPENSYFLAGDEVIEGDYTKTIKAEKKRANLVEEVTKETLNSGKLQEFRKNLKQETESQETLKEKEERLKTVEDNKAYKNMFVEEYKKEKGSLSSISNQIKKEIYSFIGSIPDPDKKSEIREALSKNKLFNLIMKNPETAGEVILERTFEDINDLGMNAGDMTKAEIEKDTVDTGVKLLRAEIEAKLGINF